MPVATPGARYVSDSSQTITDIKTGLMWSKCLIGQTGSSCSGSPTTFTWKNALANADSSNLDGYSDWRLPNIKELSSLVADNCSNPAINNIVFPAQPSSGNTVWSSSPYEGSPLNARYITFGTGQDGNGNKVSTYYIRLTRDASPIYRPLVNLASGTCLQSTNSDISAANTVHPTSLATCDYSDQQKWWYDPSAKIFRNALNFNQCFSHGNSASTTSFIYSCLATSHAGHKNQALYWSKNGSLIKASNTAKALYSSGSSANMTNYNPSNQNQQWQWQKIYGSISSVDTGRCLHVSSYTNDANVTTKTCDGSSNQVWTYDPSVPRLYSQDPATGAHYCTNSFFSASKLVVYNGGATCADGSNNNLKFQWHNNMRIQPTISGKTSLAIQAGATDNSIVTIPAQTGNDNQKWQWLR
jgi:hypothetical protein